jgi:ABC-type multidrug transport system ATPase subunit
VIANGPSIGLCPQEVSIWESLTCFEQLTFLGELYDLSRAVSRARAEELLATLCFVAGALLFHRRHMAARLQ